MPWLSKRLYEELSYYIQKFYYSDSDTTYAITSFEESVWKINLIKVQRPFLSIQKEKENWFRNFIDLLIYNPDISLLHSFEILLMSPPHFTGSAHLQ